MCIRYLGTGLLVLFSLGCALIAPTLTPPPPSPSPTPTALPELTPLPTLEPATPTATLEPTPLPQPTPTPITAINDASFSTGQVSLGYSRLLLSGMDVRIEEEVIVEQPGPEVSSPRHLVLIPRGYPLPAGSFFEPQIHLYPVARYIAIYPYVATRINALQTLLDAHGPLPVGNPPTDFPFLPIFNAGQMLVTQAHYLDFGSGRGVRYLTQYGQAIAPINNQELFYTYQGLSADGQTYIAAILPVSHPLLPADGMTPPGGDWNAFYGQFETYIQDTSTALDIQPTVAFSPDLMLLDAMIASITLQP